MIGSPCDTTLVELGGSRSQSNTSPGSVLEKDFWTPHPPSKVYKTLKCLRAPYVGRCKHGVRPRVRFTCLRAPHG